MSALEYFAQSPRSGQEFGAPRDGGTRQHEGADFSHSTRPGTVDVPMVERGIVTGNYWTDGYGWRVEVGAWSYSHLHERSALRVGVAYGAGTIVGKEGTTGWTSGPCCHVEHVQNGRKVDPVPIIRRILSGAPAGGGASPFPDITEENIMDWLIISYASTSARNGIYVASPGHWRKLTAEDWQVLNALKRSDGKPFLDGVPITTPYNDRAFDVLRSVYVNTAD